MVHRPDSMTRRGFVVPPLWAAAIEQRQAEFKANGEGSREYRPAGDMKPWLADLDLAHQAVARAVYGLAETVDGQPIDPARALAEVVAVCAAWYDAMVDPARQPAAIGG